MARFKEFGITEIIRQLQRADLFTDENVQAILEAGAEILLISVHSAYVQTGHRRTGRTEEHFARGRRPVSGKDDAPYLYVTINGKDERGQRYGAKGFVLNYGRQKRYGKLPTSYYWTNAVARAEQSVVDAMADKAAEIINK